MNGANLQACGCYHFSVLTEVFKVLLLLIVVLQNHEMNSRMISLWIDSILSNRKLA